MVSRGLLLKVKSQKLKVKSQKSKVKMGSARGFLGSYSFPGREGKFLTNWDLKWKNWMSLVIVPGDC